MSAGELPRFPVNLHYVLPGERLIGCQRRHQPRVALGEAVIAFDPGSAEEVVAVVAEVDPITNLIVLCVQPSAVLEPVPA